MVKENMCILVEKLRGVTAIEIMKNYTLIPMVLYTVELSVKTQ